MSSNLGGIMLKFALVNAITATRFVLLFVLLREILQNPYVERPIFECIVWLIMGLTDLFDGFLARKLNAQSTFGKYFDAVTDKLIAATIVPALLVNRGYPGWAAAILLALVVIWAWQSWAYLCRTGTLPKPRIIGKIGQTLWGLTVFPFLMYETPGIHWEAIAPLFAPVCVSSIALGDYMAEYGWSWTVPLRRKKIRRNA